MSKPVRKNDIKFIITCFFITLASHYACSLIKEPGAVWALLLSIMIFSIGCGALRLMHVIRDF
jgi:hypothetical protein